MVVVRGVVGRVGDEVKAGWEVVVVVRGWAVWVGDAAEADWVAQAGEEMAV